MVLTGSVDLQEAFRRMQVTGKVDSLPPPLIQAKPAPAQQPRQPHQGSRLQRRPLEPTQQQAATPSSLSSSALRVPVSVRT